MTSWSWAIRQAALHRVVADVGVGEREVVADRRVEQVDPLGDDAEQPPDVVRAQLPNIAPSMQISARERWNLSSRLTSVDLPDPLGPTIATHAPAATVRSMASRTFRPLGS